MKADKLLEKGLRALDLDCDSTQCAMFMDYLHELKRWNSAYNLTSLRSDSEIIEKHFLDSLFYLKAMPSGPLRLADAGAGAGFPGLPIGIMRPDITATLIEPSRKKTSFLRNVIRRLGLGNMTVEQGRIGPENPGSIGPFDVMLSRAAFSLTEFADKASGLIRAGGLLIISKGPAYRKELDEFRSRGETKYAINNIIDCRLPFSGSERHIISLELRVK
jgi:16S rRNA (guanine527-N7)-methyltransferase